MVKKTTLADMAHLYTNPDGVSKDTVIYEVDNTIPDGGERDLLNGYTTLYPGTINGEFFMTKGHTHEKETAEVYLGISGEGLVILQDRNYNVTVKEISNSVTVYCEPGMAHRVVNTGNEPLVFFCVCRADAGHDYDVEFVHHYYKGVQ